MSGRICACQVKNNKPGIRDAILPPEAILHPGGKIAPMNWTAGRALEYTQWQRTLGLTEPVRI